jgi:hypothetical protein
MESCLPSRISSNAVTVLRSASHIRKHWLETTITHVLKGDKSTLNTSEDLSDGEWLRHESLDLSCTLDGQFVLLGQLVHTD